MSMSFSVEYAKSNRSTCKGSKEKIEKDELRIAKVTEQERNGESIMMSAWYKVIPFFQMMKRMRKKEDVVTDASTLAGFDDLRPEDREALEKMVSDFHDPDVDFPPKAEKKAPAKRQAEDGDGGGDQKAEAKASKKPKLPEIPAEVRSGVGMGDLRAIAEELVGRCRTRGLNVPSDDAARMQLGPIVRDLLVGDSVDIAAALRAAEKAWGAKVSVECANDANAGLAAAFLELSSFEYKKGDGMKGTAYKKASKAIAECADAITSGKAVSSGKGKLPGIGKSSGEKIQQYIDTGTIAKLEEYKNDV